MKRFADIIIEKRSLFLGAIILITMLFLYQVVTKVEVKTIFVDLLPKNHAYINLHNEIRDLFGGANQAYIMVQVRDREDGGEYDDVFNFETLNIVRSISRDLLKFHAVDRYKIMSLASLTLQSIIMTSEGITIEPIMYPDVPTTQEGLDKLRDNVYASPMAYPAIVSFDSKKTMISVDFFEEAIDYRTCFKELKGLREKYENKNHIIAIAGEPMHLGYIDSYVKDVLKVLAYTLIAMMVVFFIYFRSKRGMFLPILSAAVSAVWGIGFLSLLGYNLDPLVLVFPFIIATRAASHSVQVIKRYTEEAYRLGDVKRSCKSVIEHLFVPGFAGIITDAAGVIVIALCPIPILQKICLSCAFWAFATIVHAMLLTPILLSYMPIRAAKPTESFLDRLLHGMGRVIVSWGKYPVIAFSLSFLIWGTYYMNDLDIGGMVPGSEVFWVWHRYNVDAFRIAFAMGTLAPMYVVVEGYENKAVANAEVMREIIKFTRYMQRTPDMRVLQCVSVMIAMPLNHQCMRDNDLNWQFTPTVNTQAEMIYRNIVDMAGPGGWDRFIDNDDKVTNIIVYCREKSAETIRIVIDRINEYIRNESMFGKRKEDVERHGFDKFIYWVDGFFREKEPPIPEKPLPEGMPRVHFRLAGGTAGIQAAINETLELYQIWTFLLAITTVFIFCSISFRSFFGGFIVVFPLLLSNILAFMFMVFMDPPIPLTTATLPVSAVGIGLGVDYGIYLISRIMEEFKEKGTIEEAISSALGTTGKAIIFTATTLVIGICFWFISKMMFQALMGALLAIIMIFNMLGALIIIPSIIALFKPKFITGKK
jgi:hypothetical protein